MTTVVRIRQPRPLMNFPFPIGSRAEGGTPFLVMEKCAKGVRIRPSARYGRKLNPFWQVWMRDLLRKADAKYQLRIKINTRDVRVTSKLPVDDWIMVVWNLAANVVQLPTPPMERDTSREDFFDGVKWIVDPGVNLTEIVRNVELPAAVSRFFSLSGGIEAIYLDRLGKGRRKCIFPLSDVRQMVEWQIALACHRYGVPGVPIIETSTNRRRTTTARQRVWVTVTSQHL